MYSNTHMHTYHTHTLHHTHTHTRTTIILTIFVRRIASFSYILRIYSITLNDVYGTVLMFFLRIFQTSVKIQRPGHFTRSVIPGRSSCMVSDTSATATAVALGSGIASLCRPTQVSSSETDCWPVGGHGGTHQSWLIFGSPNWGPFSIPSFSMLLFNMFLLIFLS